MRLGGPCFVKTDDPDVWVKAMRRLGYTAAYCPVGPGDEAKIDAFVAAAKKADIVIAEVGAFGNNPISPDEAVRRKSIANCQERLAHADRVGARCCVNVSGSRGKTWAGHHPDNLTSATFDLIVESVRAILDAVKPKRTYYTLETMPWAYPDSVESYERLIAAIDRPRFAVHFDAVNLVCSPQIYYNNAAMVRDAVARLGPRMQCCHLKDILLTEELTVHLPEVRAGLGGMDYAALLRELDKLAPDMPVLLEHLKTEEEYRLAAEFVRGAAREAGVTLR